MQYSLTQLDFIREAPKTLERHVISKEYVEASLGAVSDLKSIGNKIQCLLNESMTTLSIVLEESAAKKGVASRRKRPVSTYS